jgi:spore maturation protein CgeB
MDKLHELGFRNVFYLPGATNPKRFRPMELSEEEKRKYECNISFVGNSGNDVLKTYERYKEWVRDSTLCKAVDEIVKIQTQNPFLNISDVIREVEGALNLTLPNPEGEGGKSLSVCLEFAAMALRRVRMIKEISDFGVHVYGDKGWLKLLSPKSKFRGMIDYQTELPKLYNASKINLNITKSQLKTAINQRVFDISACGAFILTDYRRDLFELFEVDKEVVYYKDERDLREKAKYFLENPRTRKALSENARKKVLEKYTYQKMVEEILHVMKELFSL